MAKVGGLGAALVLVLAVSGGCDSGRRSPGPDFLDEVKEEPVVIVEVDEDGFDPDSISLEVGDAFEVVNVGEDPHSLHVDDPFVDTGDLLPSESTVVVFRTEGVHVAGDGVNPDAALEITVVEAS